MAEWSWRNWFNPKLLYKGGQPFQTFASGHEPGFLERKLEGVVGNPQEKTALEVGPGASPVIAKLPFQKRYYLDVSAMILRQLREKTGEKNLVLGDVKHIPFKAGRNFHVVVANEVLTHVPAEKRVEVAIELAKQAGEHLVITDRAADSPKYIKLKLDPHQIERDTGAVRAKPLSEALKKAGFKVEVEYRHPKPYAGYFVLHARRE